MNHLSFPADDNKSLVLSREEEVGPGVCVVGWGSRPSTLCCKGACVCVEWGCWWLKEGREAPRMLCWKPPSSELFLWIEAGWKTQQSEMATEKDHGHHGGRTRFPSLASSPSGVLSRVSKSRPGWICPTETLHKLFRRESRLRLLPQNPQSLRVSKKPS